MDLIEQLRKAAQASGLSMLALAERSGLRYMSVHRFMARGSGLTVESCEKLAQALGLEVVLRPRRPRKKGQVTHGASATEAPRKRKPVQAWRPRLMGCKLV